MSHFKLISSTKVSDVIPVNKYVSEKTGLTVIIGDVEGPIVKGFFCLATEAHDDDGLPHTLEHLIFLGSKRYPYKGILDLLANRCMAHGTNAWTDVDHTCYTVNTAGDAGMLTLLPIYLDHILWPTLTDEGFITEVHHVDGDGEDAGVVYCEMQGRENTSYSRCELLLLRAMYPDSGYSAETGGIMKNLRTSTDNKKVREFHKKFYRPENLTIVLTGQIAVEDVFKALEIVENDIVAQREQETREEWIRPWQTLPPTPKYGDYREEWPADTEDCGQVTFGWRGAPLTGPRALKELTGSAVLLRYLCDTASAPLQRCLVQIEDALAGDVSYNLTENIAPLIKIQLDNVPIDKVEQSRDEALRCIRAVRAGDEPIDMERVRVILRKQLRENNASLESDPHHVVAFRCIGDALYSQNEQDFICRMNPQEDLQELLEEDQDFWLSLLRKFFNDDVISVIGVPSIELQTKMAEDEKNRIDKQRAKLGQEGLAEKDKILKDAIEHNELPPPPGTLASVPIPTCDGLKRHNIRTWCSNSEPCPYFDLNELPIYARVHSLKTNFVYINIMFDTSKVDQMSRKWLPLHINGLAECPVRRGDQVISHDEVINTNEQLTAMFLNEIGFGKCRNFAVGEFGHFIHVETRCEPADYEQVVDHLYEILYCAELTKERLLVFAQRMINDVAQIRRNGSIMIYDSLRDSLYSKDSNVHWCTVLRQQAFLKDLMERLTTPGEVCDEAMRDAKRTVDAITEHAWLHIAADFERYNLSPEPWKKFNRGGPLRREPYLYRDADLMTGPSGGFVMGVGGLESTFLVQMSPGPLGHAPDEIAPLAVALNYFTQLEGPMWRLIRGCGLSYGYGVRASPNEGRIVFSLYRATNVIAAYTKAKSILEEYLADGKFDEDLFESAKSTALFEVVENEKCPADVVKQSLISYLQRNSEDYNRQLVCAISSVTAGAAAAAAARWLPALADASRASLALVCHPSKVDDMQAGFDKLNIRLDVYKSMEDSHFNQ